MFHEGDLQSGIAQAVAESKAVLCFVRDSTDLSDKWENVFLRDSDVVDTIRNRAVALKIEHDSQEAQFLSVLCPITSTPLVVVIKDGKIQGRLDKELDQPSFIAAIQQVLVVTDGSAIAGGHNVPELDQRQQDTTNPTRDLSNDGGETAQTTIDSTIPPASESQRSSHADADNLTTATVAQPTSDGTASNGAPSSTIESQRTDYIAQQRQREAAQRAERQRIRESIEADRRERRRKAEAAKFQPQPSTTSASSIGLNQQPSAPVNKDIRLAVRLHSGASIRSIFPPTSTLSSTIRPWISSNLSQSPQPSDANIPYSFKLILAPQPNRTISISEEEMTLQELLGGEEGLGRWKGGVNFVLVPEKAYTEAYVRNGSGIFGIPVRVVSAGVNSVVGGVYGVLGSLLGGSNTSSEAGTSTDSGGTAVPGSEDDAQQQQPRVRVRTLADQRADDSRDDKQWYNGNQLNFEPRKKDDDEDKTS